MKILVITRAFTGLVDSIITGKWNPKGLPPFYKFIEGLERQGIKGDVVLSCKRNISLEKISERKKFKFENISMNFHVLPFQKRKLIHCSVLERILNDLSHLCYCVRLVQKSGYDLIYCDQFDMHYGAFFTLFGRKKVVARLFGVGSVSKIARTFKGRIDPSLIYPSFFARFSYIICTRDGSGERYFLSNFINKKTPYEILLNGVDASKLKFDKAEILRAHNMKKGRTIILFVGKLEEHKGCREFVEAVVRLNSKIADFYAVIVGTGPLLTELKEKAVREGLSEKIIFTGAVEHNRISRYYASSDIYVSLNKLGNLSNTVLEAVNARKCVVILSPSKVDHIDEDTHEVIPYDYAVRVDRDNMVQSLTDTLTRFFDNKEMIRYYSEKSKEISEKIFKTWEERIDYEIDILESVACKKNHQKEPL